MQIVFRKFHGLQAFAEKAKILTDLTAKRVPQNIRSLWSEKHSVALQVLKQDLINACESRLHIIRLHRPYEIFVDGSGYAVGGLLCQRG